MRLLRDLTLGAYYPARSPVHALDPRAKLGACCLGAGAALAAASLGGTAGAWALLAAGVAGSRVPPGLFLRGFRPLGWLFAFTVLLHGLTAPGRAVAVIPGTGCALTREGLAAGGLVAAQLAAAVGFSSLLTLTTSPGDLVWAMERLGAPLARLGVPVGEFCVTAFVALRFFPILREEAERLGRALRARGIDPARGGPLRRARVLGLAAVPLFRQVFRRAEAVGMAMEARGYPPSGRRGPWQPSGFGARESLALALSGLTLAGALALRFS